MGPGPATQAAAEYVISVPTGFRSASARSRARLEEWPAKTGSSLSWVAKQRNWRP